jgi:hypothetical protein
VPARVHGRWCADGASLEIVQRFQRFSATLASAGSAAPAAGVRRPHRGDGLRGEGCNPLALQLEARRFACSQRPPRRRVRSPGRAPARALEQRGFAGWPGIARCRGSIRRSRVVHIVGIGLLVGSLVLVELRIWGRGTELPLAALARFGLRLTLAGFALAAASGLTMFLSQPAELLGNAPFLVKMALLLCAGVNAAAFHWRGGRRPRRHGRARPDLGLARALARHHHLRSRHRLLLTDERGIACNVGLS